MIELFLSIMIWIALIVKLKIFVKCNKYKGRCRRRDCRLKYYCDKYDNNREIADCRMKHLEGLIKNKLLKNHKVV